MDTHDYLDALRADGDLLLAAAQQGLTADVPSCPGWTVEDVVWHTAGGFMHKLPLLRDRMTVAPPVPAMPPEDTDPLLWFETGLEQLIDTLAATPPSVEVWTWHASQQTAAFWFRRSALETAVHRVDAQLAHGAADPVSAALAIDGIDEMIDVMLVPRSAAMDEPGPGGSLHLRVGDANASWALRFAPGGLSRQRDPSPEGPWDAVASGTASDILLFLWGRLAATSLSVHDPTGLLDRVRALAAVATQ